MPLPTPVDNLISFTRQLMATAGDAYSPHIAELLSNTKLAIEQVEGRASLPERVNIHLTPNQMAVLINVYRGASNDLEARRANYFDDMRFLFRNKLISFDGEVMMTPLGVQRVMEVME